MKNIILLIGIILIQHGGIIFAQSEPYIADFYNNKDAAVSITFDDASYGQFQYGLPILEKYKFNATFGVVGEWFCIQPKSYSEDGLIFYKRLSKTDIQMIYLKGNEIAWHGMKHEAYSSKMTWNKLSKKMIDEKIIASLFLGKIPLSTIFYPYSKTKGKVILASKSSGFLFGRSGVEAYNDIDDINYYLLKSFGIYNDSLPNLEKFDSILNNGKGKWITLMYHHIIPDTASVQEMYKKYNIINTYAVTPEIFNSQMEIISKKNYWVSTIYNIGRYLQQRENSDIYVETENNDIYITILCDLDSQIYNQEMTVIYNGKSYNMKPNIRTKI